jgi:16S rRNA processing protein RimM
MDAEWIEIGRIVGSHGLKGELRVYPETDFPERFEEPGTRWLTDATQRNPRPVNLVHGRYIPGKGIYVIQLDSVTDRTQADALRDCWLLVPESDRLPLEDDDEFHVRDLVGLQVFDQPSQTLIGTVVDVVPAGNDLLVIEPVLTEPPSGHEEDETAALPPHPDQRHHARRKKKRSPQSSPQILIPFVKAIVPLVDLEQGRMEITPPPGLLE